MTLRQVQVSALIHACMDQIGRKSDLAKKLCDWTNKVISLFFPCPSYMKLLPVFYGNGYLQFTSLVGKGYRHVWEPNSNGTLKRPQSFGLSGWLYHKMVVWHHTTSPLLSCCVSLCPCLVASAHWVKVWSSTVNMQFRTIIIIMTTEIDKIIIVTNSKLLTCSLLQGISNKSRYAACDLDHILGHRDVNLCMNSQEYHFLHHR